MKAFLAGTSLAAVLLLTPHFTAAQSPSQNSPQAAGQPGQPSQGAGKQAPVPPQMMTQLQQAEQSLAQASHQMGGATGGQQAQVAQSTR